MGICEVGGRTIFSYFLRETQFFANSPFPKSEKLSAADATASCSILPQKRKVIYLCQMHERRAGASGEKEAFVRLCKQLRTVAKACWERAIAASLFSIALNLNLGATGDGRKTAAKASFSSVRFQLLPSLILQSLCLYKGLVSV